jgi:hypothetical protein
MWARGASRSRANSLSPLSPMRGAVSALFHGTLSYGWSCIMQSCPCSMGPVWVLASEGLPCTMLGAPCGFEGRDQVSRSLQS